MPKSEAVIKDISKEVEIGEGSKSVMVTQTDSDDICLLSQKDKSTSNVRIYSKSKTGNKYIPIKKQGN